MVQQEFNMKNTPLIDQAKNILTRNDDEHRQYGDIYESTERTAKVASVLFGKEVPIELVTIIYIAGKLCREGFSHKEDNLVDAIAYLEILNELKRTEGLEEEEKEDDLPF